MRTTLNINDDLMLLLKEKSREVNQNLTKFVNDLLRSSHKALDLAAELETEYSIRKMKIGK